MELHHRIFVLPEEDRLLDQALADGAHQIKHIAFSTTVVDGAVKHHVLVVWHTEEYGDHLV